MKVYHGTTKAKLKRIKEDGINPPSYWGDLDIASDYSDGVILAVELEDFPFIANVQLSESISESDEEHVVLKEEEVQRSLEELDSVVCNDRIFNFEVV